MGGGSRGFQTRFRVRYAETDQMGVVYHAHYLPWFEVGRVELMRELGMVYSRLESEEGCVLPVVEVNCRYRQPAHYDEELELETRLLALRGPMVRFGYALRRVEGGVLLAEAVTTHVVVDRTTLQPCRMPAAYADVLRAQLPARENGA